MCCSDGPRIIGLERALKRRGPFFLYLAAMVALVGCISYFGWTRTWSAIFILQPSPAFLDMRSIQGAVISARQGLNPHMSNPNDPYRRVSNYPLIWVKIGEALNLPDESRFRQFCSLVILCFVGVSAYILYRFPSFVLLACLLSTATLLGIVRANTDLIIYSLVFVFALAFPKTLSPVPILVATALKLYPVFSLVIFLIKRQFLLFLLSLIATLAIFAYMWDELAIIWSIPLETGDSYLTYGFNSLAPYFSLQGLGLVTLLCLAIFVTALYLKKMEGPHRRQQEDEFESSLFLAGASIYVGTFIVWANWDYRLMFLIFCIPFLEARRFPFSGLLVVLIIVAMNDLVIHDLLGATGRAIMWFAKIGIFVVLSAYLALRVLAIFERRDDASKAH
jgi:hypothetical protein